MSRIGSTTSGVRIAAQPLSNVYTVFLMIGLLALVGSGIALAVTMNERYGTVFGVGEEGKKAMQRPDVEKAQQENWNRELQTKQEALNAYSPTSAEGAAAPTPTEAAPVPTPTSTEATPTEAAPTSTETAPPPPEGGTTPPAAPVGG